jgi:uncharacterized protein YciI
MQFLNLLQPMRDTFPGDATQEEMDVVMQHFEYLQRLRDDGKLILAGRTQDEHPIGLAIYETETEEEAKGLVAMDPAVKNGVFKATLRPYKIAVARELEQI